MMSWNTPLNPNYPLHWGMTPGIWSYTPKFRSGICSNFPKWRELHGRAATKLIGTAHEFSAVDVINNDANNIDSGFGFNFGG